jgi:hypothetical protein
VHSLRTHNLQIPNLKVTFEVRFSYHPVLMDKAIVNGFEVPNWECWMHFRDRDGVAQQKGFPETEHRADRSGRNLHALLCLST